MQSYGDGGVDGEKQQEIFPNPLVHTPGGCKGLSKVGSEELFLGLPCGFRDHHTGPPKISS